MELFDSELSSFWNIWVIAIISINIGLLIWLVLWTRKAPAGTAKTEQDATGHVFDGITELNNPMPKWWLYMLYISIVFGGFYFILYPGFGNFKGVVDWSQESQLHASINQHNKKLAPMFARFSSMTIEQMSQDTAVNKMGKGLFLTYCSVCHGSTATGTKGFPNLTDNDWLYGGSTKQIQATILRGRAGIMPPYGGIPLNAEQLNNVASYVLSLSGRKHDQVSATKGKGNFAICSACHGADGKGNQAIGAPNLTDNIWLYGRHISSIKHSIKTGFNGTANRMPSFANFLGTDKVKVLAAYIYSLSK